ncbi:amino acid ABC transporter substrate-binding protein [Achromobacter sp. F4_2707]|uniref:amino acid ABC transporter substrate-binding protein n=1 Tax=Achromobacter sp. F4_2707 TaxID=3114286 RepID=UPI0039C6CFDE
MNRSSCHQRRSLLGLLLGMCLPRSYAASAPVFSVQTESSLAHGMALLHAALRAAGFPANLANAPHASEARNLHEITVGRIHINMLPASPERLALVEAGRLRMIPVPLERGLLGWRTSFVPQGRQEQFAHIRNLEDLRTLTVGQGVGWKDLEIYRAAGIATRELQAWRNGEFVAQMMNGVIDLFPMGLEESLSYFLPYFRERHLQLMLDKTLLLHYPWHRFVWVSPHSDADELYHALQEGFDIICNNGTFEATWNQTRRAPPADSWQGRTVIRLENPFYSPDIVPQRYQHLLLRPDIS